MKIHESGEMYLENIFVLRSKLGNVRSIDIVNYSGYSKPSISRAVKLLNNAGYINVDEVALERETREKLLRGWHKAVQRSKAWEE